MIGDRELWACANEVLRQYGAQTTSHLAERCAALAAAGDRDGYRAWIAIGHRLDELGRMVAPSGKVQ